MNQPKLFRHQLADLAQQLLNPNLPLPEYGQALAKYEHLLTDQVPMASERVHTKHGVAINTAEAAACLQDTIRTRGFLLAADAAVHDQHQQSHQPVHLLYAGTGPFATLVLPLLAKYGPEVLHATGLEINPTSAEQLQQLLERLGVGAQMEVVLTDAMQYQRSAPVHILISETMQAGLRDEPQVAIFQHLIPQLEPGARIIPQEISLSLALLPENPGPDTPFRVLDQVFVLNREHLNQNERHQCLLPEFRKDYTWLALLTHIQLDDVYAIAPYESGLTYPVFLEPLARLTAKSLSVNAHYSIDEIPGLVYYISSESG